MTHARYAGAVGTTAQWICYKQADRETPHEEPVVRSSSVSGWRADELLNLVLPLHEFDERLTAVSVRIGGPALGVFVSDSDWAFLVAASGSQTVRLVLDEQAATDDKEGQEAIGLSRNTEAAEFLEWSNRFAPKPATPRDLDSALMGRPAEDGCAGAATLLATMGLPLPETEPLDVSAFDGADVVLDSGRFHLWRGRDLRLDEAAYIPGYGRGEGGRFWGVWRRGGGPPVVWVPESRVQTLKAELARRNGVAVPFSIRVGGLLEARAKR